MLKGRSPCSLGSAAVEAKELGQAGASPTCQCGVYASSKPMLPAAECWLSLTLTGGLDWFI